jgi:hypothetical protein
VGERAREAPPRARFHKTSMCRRIFMKTTSVNGANTARAASATAAPCKTLRHKTENIKSNRFKIKRRVYNYHSRALHTVHLRASVLGTHTFMGVHILARRRAVINPIIHFSVTCTSINHDAMLYKYIFASSAHTQHWWPCNRAMQIVSRNGQNFSAP